MCLDLPTLQLSHIRVPFPLGGWGVTLALFSAVREAFSAAHSPRARLWAHLLLQAAPGIWVHFRGCGRGGFQGLCPPSRLKSSPEQG